MRCPWGVCGAVTARPRRIHGAAVRCARTGSPSGPRRLSKNSLWGFRRASMEHPWSSRVVSVGCPRTAGGIRAVFVRCSWSVYVGSWWGVCEACLRRMWAVHVQLIRYLWGVRGASAGFSRKSGPVKWSWAVHGQPMGFPWALGGACVGRAWVDDG